MTNAAVVKTAKTVSVRRTSRGSSRTKTAHQMKINRIEACHKAHAATPLRSDKNLFRYNELTSAKGVTAKTTKRIQNVVFRNFEDKRAVIKPRLDRNLKSIQIIGRIRAAANFGYSEVVANSENHVDKPEPRWQVLAAFLAVAGIYLALPRSLIIGPTWLLPSLILVLLIPTVMSHRTGRRSLNRVLGIA